MLIVSLGASIGCRGDSSPPAAPPSPDLSTDAPVTLEQLARMIPSRTPRPLTRELAERLVELSLDCVDREYPNKPGNVLSSDREVVPPRALHPAFFGCFDWHSAVHGHWTMVRLLETFPDLSVADRIRSSLDRHLNRKNLIKELRYFEMEHHKLFERPYGWAWFLRLAAELHAWKGSEDAKRWAASLVPLEQLLARRTMDYLERLSLPVRAGTHFSTAFALAHIHDYATARGNEALIRAITAASRRFYLDDQGCPTDYEPSGEDFISPCLAEADLMRRVLPSDEFRPWLDRFLPPLSSRRFLPLFNPPKIRDIKDPKIGHLIGLCMQRAWTMRGIASALGEGDSKGLVLRKLADLHRERALALMFDSGYGGTHWLASFAIFMLTDAGIPKAPARPSGG